MFSHRILWGVETNLSTPQEPMEFDVFMFSPRILGGSKGNFRPPKNPGSSDVFMFSPLDSWGVERSLSTPQESEVGGRGGEVGRGRPGALAISFCPRGYFGPARTISCALQNRHLSGRGGASVSAHGQQNCWGWHPWLAASPPAGRRRQRQRVT